MATVDESAKLLFHRLISITVKHKVLRLLMSCHCGGYRIRLSVICTGTLTTLNHIYSPIMSISRPNITLKSLLEHPEFVEGDYWHRKTYDADQIVFVEGKIGKEM